MTYSSLPEALDRNMTQIVETSDIFIGFCPSPSVNFTDYTGDDFLDFRQSPSVHSTNHVETGDISFDVRESPSVDSTDNVETGNVFSFNIEDHAMVLPDSSTLVRTIEGELHELAREKHLPLENLLPLMWKVFQQWCIFEEYTDTMTPQGLPTRVVVEGLLEIATKNYLTTYDLATLFWSHYAVPTNRFPSDEIIMPPDFLDAKLETSPRSIIPKKKKKNARLAGAACAACHSRHQKCSHKTKKCSIQKSASRKGEPQSRP
ncbi:hypothetical protein B0J14DRAFT_604698 [Halenospora varia]|nr:hypothetical protein B0J14DRAFT_604698 [Halenospora varia]